MKAKAKFFTKYSKVWKQSASGSLANREMMEVVLPPARLRLTDFDRSIRCCTASLAEDIILYSTALHFAIQMLQKPSLFTPGPPV